jgi:hypothetical protein
VQLQEWGGYKLLLRVSILKRVSYVQSFLHTVRLSHLLLILYRVRVLKHVWVKYALLVLKWYTLPYPMCLSLSDPQWHHNCLRVCFSDPIHEPFRDTQPLCVLDILGGVTH